MLYFTTPFLIRARRITSRVSPSVSKSRSRNVIGELRKEGWNIITHRNHTYKGVAHTIYEHVPEGDDIKETKSNWMMPEWG